LLRHPLVVLATTLHLRWLNDGPESPLMATATPNGPLVPMRIASALWTSLASWRMAAALGTQGISGTDIYKMIVEELEAIQPSGSVLDYGAGVGNLTQLLLAMNTFDEVVGADLMSKPTDMAAGWVSGDLNDTLPGHDDHFNLVIASEVIEHLENPRFTARELYRLCSPGGHVIVTTPNNESIRSLLSLVMRGHFVHFNKGWYPGHITALLRKDLLRILIEAGFEPLGFRYSANGSLPGFPTHTWQEISFGKLGGLRFSNNLLIAARKPDLPA